MRSARGARLEGHRAPDRDRFSSIESIEGGTHGSSEFRGNLEGHAEEGSGSVKLGSGYFEGPYTFASRFEEAKGTNPEELIGAAHAGCYSMFLSALLSGKGFTPTRIYTTATVHLTAGPTISKIELNCEAEVPGVDDATFQEQASPGKGQLPGVEGAGGRAGDRPQRQAVELRLLPDNDPIDGIHRILRAAVGLPMTDAVNPIDSLSYPHRQRI